MSQCQQCGAAFYSESASWGDRTCGDCLANRIEASLLLHALGEHRKPMRRSTPEESQDQPSPAHVEASRRSA